MSTITQEWLREAACISEDPELFFPVGTSRLAANQEERARQVCGRCPVRNACLEWALHVDPEYGIWGGLSEADRHALRRRRMGRRAPAQGGPHPAGRLREASRRRTARAAQSLDAALVVQASQARSSVVRRAARRWVGGAGS